MAQSQTAKETSKKPYRSIHQGLSGVRHIVAVASGKGGVGKSTVASNLAVALRASGAKVGLMDADIYGPSQPGMLGAEHKRPEINGEQLVPVTNHGVKFISMGLLMEEDGPVVWRAPMAMKMIQQFIGAVDWGQLDYLIIDLPPGTGDVQLTLAQQAPLTGAVIVTTPQDVALGVARKGLKMFQQVNVPILGIIENMSGFTCSHCGQTTAIFKEGGGKTMADQFGTAYLGSIPLDPEIMQCSESGVPVVEEHADSSAGKAFLSAANLLREKIDQRATGRVAEPVQITLSSEGKVQIEWQDGHLSVHSPYTLRKNCACATCVDENTGKQLLDPKRIPLDIGINSYQPVGRYALAFGFSDHHNTGIYRYELLRDLCECPECTAKRGDGNKAFSV